MPTLTLDVDAPAAVDPEDVRVDLELWGAGQPASGIETATGKLVGGVRTLDGPSVSFTNVVGNTGITSPTGTVYRVATSWAGLKHPIIRYVLMPTTGGPYRLDQIETDPPAVLDPSGLSSHAANTTLHGGGQRIFAANVSANFTTASTTFVDLPGATATFTVPSRPFAVFAQIPVFVEEANQDGDVQILAGSTVVTAAKIPRQAIAGPSNTMAFGFQAPLPVWNPTAGTSVTVKVQLKSSVATSDLTVFVDFAGPIATCQLWGMTV